MCKLTKQLHHLADESSGDAILIQPIGWNDGTPDWRRACAIIRRMPSDDGHRWMFSNIMNFATGPLPCAGTAGDIETVVKSARYQFGEQLFNHELVSVSYKDTGFPHTLRF